MDKCTLRVDLFIVLERVAVPRKYSGDFGVIGSASTQLILGRKGGQNLACKTPKVPTHDQVSCLNKLGSSMHRGPRGEDFIQTFEVVKQQAEIGGLQRPLGCRPGLIGLE